MERFRKHVFGCELYQVTKLFFYLLSWRRSLSKNVFERRTSTESEAFSLFICLDTTKFVLLSFFSPIKTIYLRVSTKPQPNAAKSPLPVDVRRSKRCCLSSILFIYLLKNTWSHAAIKNTLKILVLICSHFLIWEIDHLHFFRRLLAGF